MVGIGFGGLVVCFLDKMLDKMGSTIDVPWWPPPSFGCYGSTPPATSHATISYHHMRRVYIVKTREKNINY